MTNEEKAEDITKCLWYPQECTEEDIQKMLIEMAEWKDQQLEKAIGRETFAVPIFDGRWISVVSVQRLKETLKEL